MSQTADSEARTEPAYWLLAMLTVTYTIGFIDRQVVNLLVQPIKGHFQISDTRVSLLQGLAFMSAYVLMSPVFGRLADVGNRRNILAGAAFVWSMFTIAAAASRNFVELFMCRVGVGAAEAAITPSAWSMISDRFSSERLPRALSVFMVAPYLGGGLALLFGGAVLEAAEAWDVQGIPILEGLAPWQLTLLVVGSTGMLAVVAMMTTREPPRLGAARSSHNVPRLPEVGAMIVERKGFYGNFYIGMSCVAMILYAFPAWIPTLLVRRFGTPLSQIGLEYGSVVLVTGSAGVLLGPEVARLLKRMGFEDALLRVGLICSIAIIPVCIFLYFAESYYMALTAAGLASLLYSMPQAASASALQLVTPNRMRGMTSAIYVLLASIIGLGLAPTLVAVVTDQVFQDELRLAEALPLVCGFSALAAALLLYRALPHFRKLMTSPTSPA
jgi:MFS family permease